MTLDEAIEHAEGKASGDNQCAKDHAQLSDWLRELRRARTEIAILKDLRDGYRNDVKKCKAANIRLREYVTAVANDVYGSELLDCSGCRFFDQCYNGQEKEHDGRGCQWWLWARELGIEATYGD